ncbi:MAG: phenylpyruvate tautomerase MIF-related protein [Kiritimatiellaeota bacterium]|nr:phenylpyruvate tautomerase MIF-related protein [Kiritimatiellota bacterium]
MPFIHVNANVGLPEQQQQALLAALSRTLAEVTHKPESYCLAMYTRAAALFAGQPGPAAFVDVRGIGGLTREVNQQLTEHVGAQLKKALGVPPNRLYLTFTEVPADRWGWNGKLFG